MRDQVLDLPLKYYEESEVSWCIKAVETILPQENSKLIRLTYCRTLSENGQKWQNFFWNEKKKDSILKGRFVFLLLLLLLMLALELMLLLVLVLVGGL